MRYGNQCLTAFRRSEKLGQRAAKAQADWRFLQQCVDNRVQPKFLSFKTANRNLQRHASYKSTQQQLLRAELASKRRLAGNLLQQEAESRSNLRRFVSRLDYICLSGFMKKRREADLRLVRDKHNAKLSKLLADSREGLLDPDSVIFNLTDIQLDNATKTALSKGLQLSIPGKLRRSDYLCNFEKAFRHLKCMQPLSSSPEATERFKSTFQNEALKSFYGYDYDNAASPLSRAETDALRKLARREDIVVMRPDKGNGAVIMRKDDYQRKMNELLNGRQFRRVTDDPLKIILAAERKLCNHLKKLRKKGAIIDSDYEWMRPVGSKPGIFYGLPKVHKPNAPMRPILSSIGTYNYQTCKYLVPVLEPLTTGPFTTKDSFEFVEQITSRNDADQLFMASLDVESLFTNIPAQETIQICTESLFRNRPKDLKMGKEDFQQLLQFSMDSNYFRFDGKMFQQIDGVSMGSPISPALANAFLVHHEQRWINNCPNEYRPVFYRRYVDDTFVLFRDASHLPKFLTYINGCHPNMKFTAEAEANGQLSFLDVLVQRSDNSFTTTIHRKKTATGQMMNYDTLLPANYKENVVSCLVQRAHHICSTWPSFSGCVQNLKRLLRQNGFPANFCDNVIRRSINDLRTPKEKKPTAQRKTIQLSIPFLGLRSMQTRLKLVKLCSQLYPQCHLRVIFKPIRRVQQMFSYKDRVPKLLRSNVIYKFQCGSCQATYVGETTRHLGVRASEHTGISARTQRRIRDPKASAVFDHCQRTGHQCSLTDFSVVATGTSDYDLRIKESLLIQELKPALNENCSSTELLLF